MKRGRRQRGHSALGQVPRVYALALGKEEQTARARWAFEDGCGTRHGGVSDWEGSGEPASAVGTLSATLQ